MGKNQYEIPQNEPCSCIPMQTDCALAMMRNALWPMEQAWETTVVR
ncbi:MAG: hypothetical protein HXN93_04315 [Prevotella pleuritidis]|nr:hypothetical protein [Hoylesella pleuritidis]